MDSRQDAQEQNKDFSLRVTKGGGSYSESKTEMVNQLDRASRESVQIRKMDGWLKEGKPFLFYQAVNWPCNLAPINLSKPSCHSFLPSSSPFLMPAHRNTALHAPMIESSLKFPCTSFHSFSSLYLNCLIPSVYLASTYLSFKPYLAYKASPLYSFPDSPGRFKHSPPLLAPCAPLPCTVNTTPSEQ